MPPPVKTIQEIINDLNTTHPNSNGTSWAVFEGIYGIISPTLEGRSANFAKGIDSILLKAFLNPVTGEVRYYLAKLLDIPGRDTFY